jgi:hypothetical protein
MELPRFGPSSGEVQQIERGGIFALYLLETATSAATSSGK